MAGNKEIVQLLMKYDADPMRTLISGETPLMLAEDNGFDDMYIILPG